MEDGYFHGGEFEDIKAWLRLVEFEMAWLEIEDDEAQVMFACQGLVDKAWCFYKLLSEEVQCSWHMLKLALIVKFFQSPEPANNETLLLIEEFKVYKLHFVPLCKLSLPLLLNKALPQME